MNIFQELFALLLSTLSGSGSFHIGRVNIGIATTNGTPEVVLSLGTQPSSLPSVAAIPTTVTTTTSAPKP